MGNARGYLSPPDVVIDDAGPHTSQARQPRLRACGPLRAMETSFYHFYAAANPFFSEFTQMSFLKSLKRSRIYV